MSYSLSRGISESARAKKAGIPAEGDRVESSNADTKWCNSQSKGMAFVMVQYSPDRVSVEQ